MSLVLKQSFKWLLVMYAIGFSATAFSHDSVTEPQTIKSHQNQLNRNIIFVRPNANSWVASSSDGNNTPCGVQRTVIISRDENTPAYDEVFSSLLVAAAAGKEVYFHGFCDTPRVGQFKATFINVLY